MTITSFAQFESECRRSALASVRSQILGDLDTPVSVFLKVMRKPYRFLLESVEGAVQKGRYSILGDTALLTVKVKNGSSEIHNRMTGDHQVLSGDPFQHLKTLYHTYRSADAAGKPASRGGLFGYLGYDAIRYIENIPDGSQDDLGIPDLHLFVPARMIIFDNVLNTMDLIVFTQTQGNLEHRYTTAQAELVSMSRAIRQPTDHHEPKPPTTLSHLSSSADQKTFTGMVERAKSFIQRGDVFQVVLSQRLQLQSDVQTFDIYRGLRVINPSPYMFYLDIGETSVLGSSPETLVKLEKTRITVKPIAGTRKRGASEQDDRDLIADLMQDPKERAEHTMLVDLGRNDVGRIAEYGSVQVDEFMGTEKYSHVIHLVSSVSGELKSGLDAIDVFKACFPAGTVSGAPKVRAMQIIDELEPVRRSIYAGAVGYFSFDGDMDVCIAIRTIFQQGEKIYLQAGAGIVADSVPELEYEETLNKARGLLKAIDYAYGGLT